jgi:signal transduction histidine kinase
VFAAVFLFMDTVYMSYAILACEALYLACAVYLLARLALKLRRPEAPQAVFVAGLLVFLYGAVRDCFFYNGINVLPPFDEANLTQIAVLAFAFCQAVALFMATMREVEDAKAAERQLAAENAALERANRLRADVMETISHEARTPLAVLASYSSLVALELREGAAGEQVTEDLDKIAHEAIRVANLIDEMKRLPLEPGRRAAPTDVDIAELVEQTARLYRPMLLRRGVVLTLDIADGLPHALGNPAELTQVVFNLLQNAKNSTAAGTVAVSVTADGEVETRRVSVRVADTGSGIGPELLPHVFERSTSGDGQSTGLGLAICKEIIEAHGGQIAIDSVPGAGTVVAFTLPAREGGESVAR